MSSDLGRAYKTAQTIHNANRYKDETPLLKSTLAREFNAGVYQGRNSQEYKDYFLNCGKGVNYRHIRPEGGETLEEMYGRMKSLLYDIINFSLKDEKVEKFQNIRLFEESRVNRVLVICHAGWIRQLQNFLHKILFGEEFKLRTSVRNCSLTRIKVDRDDGIEGGIKFEILAFGDHDHMKKNVNGVEVQEEEDPSDEDDISS